ncbi:helix-turn-helix domain-containing protein [Leucobacter chromiiresistens]
MRSIAQINTSRSNGGNRLVAANIRAELAYAEMTQGALAEALGLSAMAVSRRLKDQTEFTAGEIVTAAELFGIAPGDLFASRSGKSPASPKVQPKD